MADVHECPAPACEVYVPDAQLACRRHWFQLPKGLRNEINQHYVRGQSAAMMSDAYAAALADARSVWASKR